LVEKKQDKLVHGVAFEDFKTIADVLMQVCIRHDILKFVSHLKLSNLKFPEMGRVEGEESPILNTRAGVPVKIEVMSTPDETQALLEQFLVLPEMDARQSRRAAYAAEKLAQTAHEYVPTS
jgi:hypothetical protein